LPTEFSENAEKQGDAASLNFPASLFNASIPEAFPTRSARAQPRMDTDQKATTKHTKDTKGDRGVPRHDLL
jgi:hypothetical protein